mmetsp:Transcript_36123/g.102787  ORF Transcript_36123/g.102787 Transcript_36123/m.102787 type:complete len:629 (+) Transcript_36123:732-2618(+)
MPLTEHANGLVVPASVQEQACQHHVDLLFVFPGVGCNAFGDELHGLPQRLLGRGLTAPGPGAELGVRDPLFRLTAHLVEEQPALQHLRRPGPAPGELRLEGEARVAAGHVRGRHQHLARPLRSRLLGHAPTGRHWREATRLAVVCFAAEVVRRLRLQRQLRRCGGRPRTRGGELVEANLLEDRFGRLLEVRVGARDQLVAHLALQRLARHSAGVFAHPLPEDPDDGAPQILAQVVVAARLLQLLHRRGSARGARAGVAADGREARLDGLAIHEAGLTRRRELPQGLPKRREHAQILDGRLGLGHRGATQLQRQTDEGARGLQSGLLRHDLRADRRGAQLAASFGGAGAGPDEGAEVNPGLADEVLGQGAHLRQIRLLWIVRGPLLRNEVDPSAACAVQHLPELPQEACASVAHDDGLLELHGAPEALCPLPRLGLRGRRCLRSLLALGGRGRLRGLLLWPGELTIFQHRSETHGAILELVQLDLVRRARQTERRQAIRQCEGADHLHGQGRPIFTVLRGPNQLVDADAEPDDRTGRHKTPGSLQELRGLVPRGARLGLRLGLASRRLLVLATSSLQKLRFFFGPPLDVVCLGELQLELGEDLRLVVQQWQQAYGGLSDEGILVGRITQ